MSKWFVLALMILIVGCQGGEPDALKDSKPREEEGNPSSKPVNGQLKSEPAILQIGRSDSGSNNTFELPLDYEVKVLTKDFFFATEESVNEYMINVTALNGSCTTRADERFFLIADSVFTELTPGKPFQLKPYVNYRLRFYNDNLSCTRLKVSFAFKQL